MSNPHITKLRLIYERTERALKIAREQKEAAWLAYLNQMRADGLCANCEKPLTECKCVLIATGGYVEASEPYIVGEYTPDHVVPRVYSAEKVGNLLSRIDELTSTVRSIATQRNPTKEGKSWYDIYWECVTEARSKLPESEEPSSASITPVDTLQAAEIPARQSGSPEVDPSGERLRYLPCPLVFKGKDCTYTGPVETCNKTYDSCRDLSNLHNFRGWPISEERRDYTPTFLTPIICPYEHCGADVLRDPGCDGQNQSCPIMAIILQLGAATCEWCRKGAPLTMGWHRPTGKGGNNFRCTAKYGLLERRPP